MVNISRIVKGLTNISSDTFSHIRIKAPQESPEGSEKLAGEISKQASEAAANYAQAIVKKRVKPDQFDLSGTLDREFALKRIKHLIKKYTQKDDLIPIEDAIKEIDVLPINDDAKLKILRGCVFETGEKELKVSKPAVYIAKYAILDNCYVVPNKFQTALRTAMDEKTMSFNLEHFYSLFSPYEGQWHILVDYNGLKPRIGNSPDRYINMEYMSQITEAFEKVKKGKNYAVHVKTSDIFRPLDKYSEELTKEFDTLIENGEDIPQDLAKGIRKALSEYNFDTSKVFKDYYGLLKECTTLEEVKTFYPELKFPTEAPKHDPGQSKYYLFNRLALGDFEASVIEALKKLYTELQPYNMAYVSIKGSTATNVANLNKAGFKFGRPSDDLLAFFEDCKKTEILLDKISRLDKEKFGSLIERHALRTSGVWKDYEGLTKAGKWMPIKLIRNKRMYPETTKYSTEKLIDTYLFNLFIKDPYKKYSPNPLQRFDSIGYLSEHGRNLLNRTYMIRFLTKDKDLPANIDYHKYFKIKKAFDEFKKQFDLEALANSIEHLEDVYHRQFYRNYWTSERMEILQKQVQKSQDIAYEKVIWGEELRKKSVDIKQVKRIVKAEEGIANETGSKLIPDKDVSTFRYLACKIKNQELRAKFMTAIAQGTESDQEYFKLYNDILKESDLGKTIDETKAEALLSIHEKYLSEVFEGSKNITEETFKEEFLAKYKTKTGIDYQKIISDTQAESTYLKLSSKLMEEQRSIDLLTELERRYKDDYVSMNEIIKKYISTPNVFKEKFAAIYTNSTSSCPNVVLTRELDTFLNKIEKWHMDRDEIIMLDKEKIGQNNEKFSQNIVIPLELKERILKLSGENYEAFDDIIQKLYNNGKKRTGESRGTGIKTWSGKDYAAEIKILGNWGGWRLYARLANPEDIEKYGQVKYVFYDVVKTH